MSALIALDALVAASQQQVSVGIATVAIGPNGRGIGNRRLYQVSQFFWALTHWSPTQPHWSAAREAPWKATPAVSVARSRLASY